MILIAIGKKPDLGAASSGTESSTGSVSEPQVTLKALVDERGFDYRKTGKAVGTRASTVSRRILLFVESVIFPITA